MCGQSGLRGKVLLWLCVIATLCASAVASTGPSPALKVLLDTKLPVVYNQDAQLETAVNNVILRGHDAGLKATPCVGIEFERTVTLPHITSDIPAGTLSEQFDWIAKLSNYIWQANGETVNFVPKAWASDPSYIMNQRIPGQVAVSRDGWSDTSIKGWFSAHRVIFGANIHSLKLTSDSEQPAPPPVILVPGGMIVMHNPTLREYFNAQEMVRDNSFHSFDITLIPSTDSKSPPGYSVGTTSRKADGRSTTQYY